MSPKSNWSKGRLSVEIIAYLSISNQQSAISNHPEITKLNRLTSAGFVIRYVGLDGVRAPNPTAGGCESSVTYPTDVGMSENTCAGPLRSMSGSESSPVEVRILVYNLVALSIASNL